MMAVNYIEALIRKRKLFRNASWHLDSFYECGASAINGGFHTMRFPAPSASKTNQYAG
jgi:hypothetical protein